MQPVAISAEDLGIEKLRDRIDGWRQSAPKTRAMPEELWKEACAAAKRLGACRVARALGVKYDTLRQRVLAGGGEAGGMATVLPGSTQFIELAGFSAASHMVAGDEAVIEVVAADGARLTVRLKGAGLDVPALVNGFRGRS
ncbi:MAG: hypothetical protein ACREFT_02150 [Acetobacteraceae bacterium]